MAKAPTNQDFWLDLPFPVKGVDVSIRDEAQPPGTTIDARNVRGIGPRDARVRGSQREGLAKFLTLQVSGSASVQCLAHVVSTATAVSGDLDTRVVIGIAVAAGDVTKFAIGGGAQTTPTNGANAMSATAAFIFATEHTQRLYFLDGAGFFKYTASSDTVASWAASPGTLPSSGGTYPRLICTWRGRIVLSGIRNDPQNWFMSAVGDPDNWDYAPATTTVLQAVAGNNADAGKVGDVVTGLVPAGDDTLIFLCEHSVWRMTGDPMEGGRIDLISDVVGGAFGQAWCKDTEGNIYFYAFSGGVFKLPRGSVQLERLSRPVDEIFKNFNDNRDTLFRMVWDERQQGFYLFNTRIANSIVVNYFYDARLKAWWLDTYADADFNPLAVDVMDNDGGVPNNRVILLGGRDGFVRYIEAGTNTDDGETISSYVFIGPVKNKRLDAMILKELQCIMANEDGIRNELEWEVYAGSSARETIGVPGFPVAPAASGTFYQSRNRSTLVRAAGSHFYIRLFNTDKNETWSFEQLQGKFRPLGMVRQRTVVE